ncbi:uncharacterized protein [Drosophila pseudoobscura]|uniref:Uncharacterized protein isoform X2 n=1 Tax=Drosophila pseudoobscura pseudoobscura TaxID=46245 RepID=A0A6I8VHC0_DROPS|nr:uncharacterized protein LOC6901842 isoform X2 [Drosophila pseudoobscura]
MPKKYSNPVNKYFVYNEDTRKSTCLQCLFDMAGKHSENLMRHLKRRHHHTYAALMEMRRLRHNRQNQSPANSDDNAEADEASAMPLSSMFQFSSEAKKLMIRMDPATIMTTTMETGDEDDKASSSRLSNDQFESIFIGKSEVPDVVEVDFSGDQLIDHDKMRYSQSLNQSEPPITAAMTMTSTPSASASAPRTSSVALLPSPTLSADDAFFLQYLGNKFGNYSTRTKHTVQFQINRILYRADMGCFEDADASQLNESEIV